MGRPGAIVRWAKEKIKKVKTRVTRRSDRLGKTWLQLVIFFLKLRRFDFKKIELTQATWSKPGTRALDRVDHQSRFKNFAYKRLL